MASKTIKELKEEEKQRKEEQLLAGCNQLADERYTPEQMKKWSKEHNGLWFLPITDNKGKILALGIMKPITRSILSYASTKMQEEGLYEFLEAGMRACWIEGDESILDNDEFFIPASQTFNKMMEGYNGDLLKR